MTERRKKKRHRHKFGSLAYAMSGKGHIAMCIICRKDFNKKTGKLEEAF